MENKYGCSDEVNKAQSVPCNPNHVNELKMQQMQVCYKLLKMRYPQMNKKQLTKKTLEYFNIKLQ